MIPHDVHVAADSVNLADMEQLLRRSLQVTFFSNDRNSSPRRIGQLARELAESFARYMSGHTLADESVRGLGERLARDGIGHQSLLGLVDALHSIGWTYPLRDTKAPASVRYCNPLLAGYMRAREECLLKEQEQTRLALDRARSKISQ